MLLRVCVYNNNNNNNKQEAAAARRGAPHCGKFLSLENVEAVRTEEKQGCSNVFSVIISNKKDDLILKADSKVSACSTCNVCITVYVQACSCACACVCIVFVLCGFGAGSCTASVQAASTQ
jgi:hypothetical protein